MQACSTLDEEDRRSPREVVFAGLGEPLLRLPVLLSLLSRLQGHPDIKGTRLNTNGLVPEESANDIAAQLHAAGLSKACVQLQTADAAQHESLVQPRKGL